MHTRDDEFLNRKLQELRNNVHGKATSITTSAGPSFETSLPQAKAKFEIGARNVIAPSGLATKTNYQWDGASVPQEVISIEEYKSRNPDLNFQKQSVNSASFSTANKPGSTSSVFEQIYKKIEAPVNARPLESTIFSKTSEFSPINAPQTVSFAKGTTSLHESRIPVMDRTEKHEANLVNDLGRQLNTEVEVNSRLAQEISYLMKSLESEQIKTAEIDEQFHSELRETKERENSQLLELADLERKLAEANMQLRQEEEKTGFIRTELDVQRRENETMRSELKRLGEITGNKIIELENNMNNAVRMKEFEVENFQMEKANLTNTCEFVIEQMKLRFGERIAKLDEQTRAVEIEKDKFLIEGKSLLDQLKGFNAAADQKITNILRAAQEERAAKNESQMNEITRQIQAEEEELANCQRRTQDLLMRLQSGERDGKSKIVMRKNDTLRLKEELASLEQQFNRFLVTLNSEEKESEKKTSLLARLEYEARNVRDKAELIGRKFNEEEAEIRQGHAEDLNELNAQLAASVAEEQQIQEEMARINQKVVEFQKRHNQLITQLQDNLNNTLKSVLPTDQRPLNGMGMGQAMGASEHSANGLRMDQYEEYNY